MRLLKRFIRDARGVSIVEFALISPLLILFYFATVEVDSALTVHRRVTAVAGTVADLVAQDTVVNTTELNAIYDSAAAIMAPYDQENTIKLRVSSVRIGSGGKARVVWSDAHNWTARAIDEEVTIPDDLIAGSSTVIMAESEFSYSAPLAQVMDRPLMMKQTFYMRPRRTAQVCLERQNAPNLC